MNNKEKEQLLTAATILARAKLKINEELELYLVDKDLFPKNTAAIYDIENFVIKFNKDWLYNRATKEDIIKTAFHEIYHVYQHTSVLKKEHFFENNSHFTNEELEEMKEEFNNIKLGKTNKSYENQTLEVDAEAFSIVYYDEYYKTFGDDHNKLIEITKEILGDIEDLSIKVI